MTGNRAYKYVDREISWLSFNARVLQEAADPNVPLGERLNFLAIYSSNLDEFFRVRVASLRTLLRVGRKTADRLGFDPARLLRRIHRVVTAQQTRFGEIFRELVVPDLARNGIMLVDETRAAAEHTPFLREFFDREVRPRVRPVFLDEDGASPFLPNRGLFLVIELWEEDGVAAAGPRYALHAIPTPAMPRFVTLPGDGESHAVMFLDDVIRFNLPAVFPSFRVGASCAIKLTRDAELYLEEDELGGNIVEAVRKSLSRRETGTPSRFLYDMAAPGELVGFLRRRFDLKDEDMVPGGRYHNLHDLSDFPRFGRRDLAYAPHEPLVHPELAAAPSLLAAIAAKDRLLHLPYQSFDPLLRLLREAAADPAVEEIWITLYRVARDSAVVAALMQAARAGKNVTAFVEVKARFDEESNLLSAEQLEQAGVRTLYSLPGLKVHAKLALIVRREDGGRRSYAYLSTGNFNERTARAYVDHGLFTARVRLTADVRSVFAYLAGETETPVFNELLVAPFHLRAGFYSLIDAEIAAARAGRPSGMILKMNSLEDEQIIARLYDASRAGVPISLIVRGICRLRPGIDGQSANVQARSILDRFLEHSRIYLFRNGGDAAGGHEILYLASADWMNRNLSHRIEVAFPIHDPGLRAELRTTLAIQLRDDTKARILDRDQRNRYAQNAGGDRVRAQFDLHRLLQERVNERTTTGIGAHNDHTSFITAGGFPMNGEETIVGPGRGSEDAPWPAPETGAGETPGKRKKDGKKKQKKKKQQDRSGSVRGIETMFRSSYHLHVDMSSLADSKANIMITINGLVVSITIASIAPRIALYPLILLPTIVLLVACVVSMVYAVLSARPRVSSSSVTLEQVRQNRANILFFGNFVKLPEPDFVTGMTELMNNTDLLYASMIRDIYSLGRVLDRKFRLLRVSYTIFMAGLVLGVALFIAVFSIIAAGA